MPNLFTRAKLPAMKRVLWLCIFLAACDAEPTTPDIFPSPPEIPVTEIPTPPLRPSPNRGGVGGEVATPSPAIPPIAAPTRAPLLAALNKTLAAQKYRVTMQMNVKPGNAPAFALSLQGEASGDNSHSTFQLGGESIELTVVRGQNYAKGARALGVPNLTKWYSITPDLADAVRFPFAPAEILAALAATGMTQNFKAGARQVLDGMNCQIWNYAPASLADAGIAHALGLDAPNTVFGAVEQSAMNVWICDDGAWHQWTLDVASHKPNAPNEKGTLRVALHIWDFNSAAITIVAPANAEPFQIGAPKP
ncbi:MAG: hypothetical protein HY327_00215 [Chloroflexi bacterium]|nr:hypothetical protein [Chloroflexota bacterium]